MAERSCATKIYRQGCAQFARGSSSAKNSQYSFHGGITSRRPQVVSCGCPDKEIQSRLGLEYPTVRFHLGNAFKKLRAANRAALVGRVRLLLEHQDREIQLPSLVAGESAAGGVAPVRH